MEEKIMVPNAKMMEGLLNEVGKKLGKNPAELKAELEQGKFDSAFKNMDAKDAATLNMAIKNPKMVEKLMSAPQAQALYKKLSGGK
jgi:hypothetical protein